MTRQQATCAVRYHNLSCERYAVLQAPDPFLDVPYVGSTGLVAVYKPDETFCKGTNSLELNNVNFVERA